MARTTAIYVCYGFDQRSASRDVEQLSCYAFDVDPDIYERKDGCSSKFYTARRL